MDLTRKLELLEQAVRSIAEHDDAPQKEFDAAMKRAERILAQHHAAAIKRRKAGK